MNLYYFLEIIIGKSRVAEVGSLSASAEMVTLIFVTRIFAIFTTNASFLHMIANLHICKLVQYKMQYIPCSIFLLSLDVVNIIEDQCRGPIMKEKDHLDG